MYISEPQYFDALMDMNRFSIDKINIFVHNSWNEKVLGIYGWTKRSLVLYYSISGSQWPFISVISLLLVLMVENQNKSKGMVKGINRLFCEGFNS